VMFGVGVVLYVPLMIWTIYLMLRGVLW